ncbi:MAG: hypothetical protein CSYNP_01306 [Syntrophus sp. SKADARSKE-3]|nr:hypothetical protein [Syntrophus sp. SKADARSKE-3]
MKPYEEQNYYELLDIETDASPFEIRHAFQEMFERYKSDSIVSYSFFSEEQRKEILNRLEEAYLNLIDEKSRCAYDLMLISNGKMSEDRQFRDRPKAPIPLYNNMTKHTGLPSSPVAFGHEQHDAIQNDAVKTFLNQDILSGSDLRAIRTTLGVSLDKIAGESKIKISILQDIEADRLDHLPPLVYVKGFVKLYARCLQVDDTKVVNAYMRHMSTKLKGCG